MCNRCNYSELLGGSGIAVTPYRLMVLEIIGNSPAPLSPQDIYATLRKSHRLNRVTLYRILDLLVEKKLVERISSGDRSFRYGPAPGPNHPQHPHFYCEDCGHMECLDPSAFPVDLHRLASVRPSQVRKVQVRLDGVCGECLRRKEDTGAGC